MLDKYFYSSPYDDCIPDRECRECNEKNEILDESADYLERIMDILYGVDTIDEVMLEDSLEQLCHYLNVKMKTTQLTVQRKKPVSLLPGMQNWIGYNNEFLKKLAK